MAWQAECRQQAAGTVVAHALRQGQPQPGGEFFAIHGAVKFVLADQRGLTTLSPTLTPSVISRISA